MPAGFFKHIPSITYDFKSDGKFYEAKDMFRKVSVWNYLQEGVAGYSYYRIVEGERPDVVATRLYGDATLYWLFFLVNENLQDLSDWPKSQSLLNKYLDRKYSGTCLIASTSTDIVSYDHTKTEEEQLASRKFVLGEKVSQSSSVFGFVTDVNPTHTRITLNNVKGTFTANYTATGSESGKSFTISSVVDEKAAVNHYVSQNYPNNLELKTTAFNAVPGAVLEIELDTETTINATGVNVGYYVVSPTSDKLPISEHTAVSISFLFTPANTTTGDPDTISDITIALPSIGYSYSEGLIVTKNMLGGQNSTAENLGSATFSKFTIKQVGNTVVTNEEYEITLNDEKHLIRYVEPRFAGRVISEFIDLMGS